MTELRRRAQPQDVSDSFSGSTAPRVFLRVGDAN